jgi:hypothetical protein
MDTNHNSLALRRQSIRTLTADELSIAHGGQAPNTTVTSNPKTRTGTCIPTRTGAPTTQTKN